MGRYMYGHIIKKFEVKKIGNRNQLYFLDNEEVKFVKKELENVIDFKLYDFVKTSNKIEVILKDDIFNKYFKSLIDEINSIYQMNGYGFMFEEDNNASYFEQPLIGNKNYLICDNFYNSDIYVKVDVYSFLRDYEKYGSGNDSFISYLLTRLARKVIDNELSSSVIFSVD